MSKRRRISNFTLAAVVAALLGGTAAGVAGYTFVYARGASYLGNDPQTCANCHVMSDHLSAWQKSSHHAVAKCNDCHAPHDFFGKYYVKAKNGWHHSFAFTTGEFHEPIQMTAGNRKVTEEACRSCHAPVVEAIDTGPHGGIQGESCIRCHRAVGHPLTTSQR